MLPFESTATGFPGPKPSSRPLKLYNTLKPPCAPIRYITPQPSPTHCPPLPPATVVPYMLPDASIVTPPCGFLPSLKQLNVHSVRSVQRPCVGVSSSTVPQPSAPPCTVVTIARPVEVNATDVAALPPSLPPVKL